jgi:hypothetical protein
VAATSIPRPFTDSSPDLPVLGSAPFGAHRVDQLMDQADAAATATPPSKLYDPAPRMDSREAKLTKAPERALDEVVVHCGSRV